MNFISFIIICFLYSYALLLFYITFSAKSKGEKGAFINNFIHSLIFVLSISINLLIVNFSNLSNINFIVFPFDFLMNGFIVFFLPLFYIFILNEKRKIKKVKGNFNKFDEISSRILPLKYDIYRKLTHLVVLGIILFYFTLGFLVQNFVIYVLRFLPDFASDIFFSIFQIEENLMIFTQYLVVFLVGISLIGLLTADFVRILKPEVYPLKPVNRILREKELHMRFGPQISMAIGCFSIIILYGLFQPIGPIIICASMIMSIFGDMAANLIGRTMGSKTIRNTNKTYEGLISGIVVAYISGMIFLMLIKNYYSINIIQLFIFPLIGGLIIGIIDYFDLVIDDNLSFPFTVSTVLFFLSFMIS